MTKNFNDIITSEQLTLVDIYATWCGPCKMMHPVLEQLKAQMGDAVRIIKIDVDKHQSLAMQLQVQSVPTLLLYRAGQQLWRQSGAITLPQLTQVIQTHA